MYTYHKKEVTVNEICQHFYYQNQTERNYRTIKTELHSLQNQSVTFSYLMSYYIKESKNTAQLENVTNFITYKNCN